MHLGVDGLVRRRIQAASAFHAQKVAVRAVGVVDSIDQAVLVGRLQKNARRRIPEQDAGGSVGVVGDGAHFVRTDHHHLLVAPAFDELRTGRERKEEAGARCGEVEPPCVVGADLRLNEARRGGKQHVGRDSGDDDRVDLAGVDVALFQNLACCTRRHVRGRLVVIPKNPPLSDPGTGANPFVTRVHHLLQIGIRKPFLGEKVTNSGDGSARAGLRRATGGRRGSRHVIGLMERTEENDCAR